VYTSGHAISAFASKVQGTETSAAARRAHQPPAAPLASLYPRPEERGGGTRLEAHIPVS
jgi:hypothetical protein